MTEKITIEEFGSKIKSKYPDYNKFSDDEIGNRMLQKYPMYADKIKPIDKGVSGVRGFAVGAGKGIISSLAGASSLGEKILRKATGFEQAGQTSAERLIPKGLTEAKGSAEKFGFGATKVAEFFAPAGIATKGATALRGLAGATKLGKKTVGALKLGATGLVGAGETGAVRAIQTGGDVKETAKAAGLGAVGGVGGELLAKGIGVGISGLAKKTPTVKLEEMKRNIRTLQNKYDEGVRYGKEAGKRIEISNPIKTLQDRKLVPQVVDGKVNSTEIINKLDEELQSIAQPRKTALTQSKKTVSFNNFKKDVLKTISESKELKNTGQVKSTIAKANNILEDFKQSFGNKIHISTIDDIRVEMNKKFDPDLNDTFRAIGNSARKQLYALDKGSRPTLQKEGEILSARAFAEALNNRPVTGGRLGGYFSSVLGSIVGGSTQIPVAGPVIGALGAKALDKRIKQSFFKVPGAETAQKIEQFGKKLKDKTNLGKQK